MPYLEVSGLTKRYRAEAGVFGLSLALERGRILALLGPSGSGKTTTLRLLGGFEVPDDGRILVDGEDVTRLRPEARRFGMVFQHYALFPHLDVGENVAFGLEALGIGGPELRERVAEALALVDLAGFERRRVAELSGGQQQRVALARALAPRPRVLLLDEPLSNLDPALRERTRRELRRLIRRVGITTVIVTHEQEEAFDLGDVIALLERGRLVQVGPPEDLYARPAAAFVAGFVGRASVLEVELVDGGRGPPTRVRVGGVLWDLPVSPVPGRRARLYIRPEAIELVPPAPGLLAGRVADRRYTGAQAYFLIATAAGEIEVLAAPDAARVDTEIGLRPGRSGFHLFPLEAP
ncbi:MAG TPA: ABC transporter ATP-binding protein [Gemmatimonadales bacterium]|nr:ABC transporter ATP-binding protein [Gemmatimonadales bacterium]